MKGFVLVAFAANPVIWAIIALALLCYIVEFDLLLGERDAQWRRRAGTWLSVLPTLLGALPLLGLLATFRTLAGSPVRNELDFVSTGVANALVTTQLGMITVIPALLIYTFLRRRQRELLEP